MFRFEILIVVFICFIVVSELALGINLRLCAYGTVTEIVFAMANQKLRILVPTILWSSRWDKLFTFACLRILFWWVLITL